MARKPMPDSPYDRFSKLPDGRVLDDAPIADDKDILVFDKASGKWVNFSGTLGEWRQAIGEFGHRMIIGKKDE
jgi:hypothetical protein